MEFSCHQRVELLGVGRIREGESTDICIDGATSSRACGTCIARCGLTRNKREAEIEFIFEVEAGQKL